jgi:hypothetical protein
MVYELFMSVAVSSDRRRKSTESYAAGAKGRGLAAAARAEAADRQHPYITLARCKISERAAPPSKIRRGRSPTPYPAVQHAAAADGGRVMD